MYKKFVEKNYKELLDILNCLKVGVYITDGNGKTLLLNDESCKTGGLERSETVGKNMRELERMGFIEESVSLKTIESGKEEMIIQNLGDGDKVYVTGTPLKSDKGIDVVVCTERDITETLTLKELLEEKNKDNAKIKDEIEYLRKQNIVMWGNMIAEDFETKLLAEKATRVAKLDATVLLTGDSGNGERSLCKFHIPEQRESGQAFYKGQLRRNTGEPHGVGSFLDMKRALFPELTKTEKLDCLKWLITEHCSSTKWERYRYICSRSFCEPYRSGR